MFLSLWVLRIVLCFFLYGFWGLLCVFFSLWVLRIALCVFFYMGSEDYFLCFVSMGSDECFVFFSQCVLRIVLCVFVYMGSEDYFVCFCLL